MRHLYWWRVVAEHGYVRHAEKRAGNGIDFGCAGAGAGDGGGYRHGRDQVYQRGAAVGRTGRRRCAGVRQHQRAGVGFYPYFSGRPDAAVPANQLRLCGDARPQLGRWGYVVCQCIVVLYLLLATIGSVFPEVFTVEGETSGQILHVLILQKIPDVVILALLFVPTASRRFFAARK